MQTLPRRVYWEYIQKDLQKKMVFIGGPRQIGKTTLACSFLNSFFDGHPGYLNWDNDLDRSTIQKQEWSKEQPLVIFDEIHKKKGWQRFVKGAYDTWKNNQKYIVTGSARLDVYRKGGDSMMGRYHYYRIHPYTLPELGYGSNHLNALLKFGGFPEPLLEQDERELRRWHLQRVPKLIKQDLRDLENVSDLSKVELLADTLQSRVGSLLSMKSLSEDLETSDKTIKRWIQILDNLYYCYLISPFGGQKLKVIKKSQKLYLWDWSQVEDKGARFENMVASHLLKLCHYWEDVLGFKAELRYIRSDNQKECDFIVLKNKKPVFAVECKTEDTNVSENIHFFMKKINIPMWYQVTLKENARVIAPNFKILSFELFCKEVGMV